MGLEGRGSGDREEDKEVALREVSGPQLPVGELPRAAYCSDAHLLKYITVLKDKCPKRLHILNLIILLLLTVCVSH